MLVHETDERLEQEVEQLIDAEIQAIESRLLDIEQHYGAASAHDRSMSEGNTIPMGIIIERAALQREHAHFNEWWFDTIVNRFNLERIAAAALQNMINHEIENDPPDSMSIIAGLEYAIQRRALKTIYRFHEQWLPQRLKDRFSALVK